MLSGAGGALARRRPEISCVSLLLGPLVFGFFLFSFFSVNLPKNPNLSSFSVSCFSDRHLWNGEREQCSIIFLNQTSSINMSLNRATEFLHQSNDIRDDATGQIWGLYRTGKQTKPDPALRPSSRDSDRHLCNGAREQRFLISLHQTSPTNLSLKLISEETISNGDRTTRKTEFLHQSNDILGQTSEKHRDDTSNDSRSGPIMDVGSIPLPPPSTLTPAPPAPAPARRSMPSTLTPASTPMVKQPPLGLTMGMATGETLIMMDCCLGLGLAVPGPKRFRPRPVYEFKDPGPLSCLKPYHLIVEDIQKLAKSSSSLPSKFIPRSDNSLADVLAKTAVRSMTIGFSTSIV